MRHTVVRLALVAGVLCALGAGLLGLGAAHAQSGGGYELTWSSVDGGGVMFATGGGYTLGGTIGQPDAGSLSGGGYTLGGGFWGGGGGAAPRRPVYVPLVIRG